MIDRIFLAHPRAAGETYLQHQRVALSVAGELLAAGLACVVHAIVPALCERTGSTAIKRLHDRVILHRAPAPAQPPTRA